jgi:hypothetical protein
VGRGGGITGSMAREMTDFRKLEARLKDLNNWLRENAPECFEQQKHLDEGSQERIYWNYGYTVALRDVIKLMTGNSPASQKSCKPDSSSTFPTA